MSQPKFWTWKHSLVLLLAVTIVGVAVGTVTSSTPEPTRSAFELDSAGSYSPGTEKIAEDEMRITALGTGLPVPFRTDASSSWLVELGNGDIFLFDIGSGTTVNFNSMRVPYNKVKGVFVSHLHIDHVGDFLPHWISGWTAGRYEPMRIWGPSGPTPEFGTAHFVNHQLESVVWDIASRQGVYTADGSRADVHEFDYSKVQVIYDENGVTVTSFPQPHGIDGAVGYRMDWNGLSFVYGGDAAPNRWLIEHAQNVDVLVHEAIYLGEFNSGGSLRTSGLDLEAIAGRVLRLHTQPLAVGRVFELTQPRIGVVFHYTNLPKHDAIMRERVESIYANEVVYASDLTVINVLPDEYLVRKVVLPDYPPARFVPESAEASEARREDPPPMSEWLQRGLLDLGGDNYPEVSEAASLVLEPILDSAVENMPSRVDPKSLLEPTETNQ